MTTDARRIDSPTVIAITRSWGWIVVAVVLAEGLILGPTLRF